MKTKLFFILGFIAVLLIISSFTNCYQSHNSENIMMPVPQYDNYESDWKRVSSYEKQGLPKSALKIIEEIYDKAKKENNTPQFIKATIYKIKLKSEFGEDFMESAISDIKTEIKESGTPEKQILHSIEAELYWRYYQSNRHKFLDRTTTGNFDNKDIKTWDLKHLINAVITNYLASLQNPDELKQTNLKAYEVIIDSADKSKEYRPTLYDFLAHRAVDFFSDNESTIVQPAYRFEIDNEEYFADVEIFVNLKPETKDSLSLKYYAITILQDLSAFHLKDKNPTAIVDVDLKRLQFVRQNSILQNKDSLYLSALENIEKQYSEYPVSADVSYLLATLHNDWGNRYNPLESDKYKWEIKTAFEICERTINRFPEATGANNCQLLKEKIEQKRLEVTTDKVNIPDKLFLALAEYKNLNKIYFRIVKADYKEYEAMGQKSYSSREIVKKYLKSVPEKSWSYDVPDDGDFQSHSVEVKIPEIAAGFYILLTAANEEFDYNKTPVNYGAFWMSNISYVTQKSTKGSYNFYVLNRETGKPIKSVKAKRIYKKYDYDSRKYVYSEGEIFTSDDKGYFEMPEIESGLRTNSFSIEFTAKNDRWITDQSFYQSHYADRPEKTITKTWFFTDRSIYRPGQTIYFKGIVLEKTGDKYEIKPNFRTKVIFRDVNYQQISEQELTTNEFGSFQGTVTAPAGVLNGYMTIKNESGTTNISVEEYKRPKFEVEFSPVEGSYKLNENVKVSGIAKAFAGNNITNAQVKYRVIRKVSFPFWRYDFFGWIPQPQGNQMEITNGITTTDENGRFEIEFKAIPDNSMLHSEKPVFNYEITADVTDVNGETQSSDANVSVGYTALLIDINIPETIEKNSFKEFILQTTNLNGQSEPAAGKITILKLKEPSRLLVGRNWREPDVLIIPEADFVKDFPHHLYKNENRLDKLEVDRKMSTIEFNTKTDSIYKTGIAEPVPGRYVVDVVTKDAFGQKVEIKKYFTIYDMSNKQPPVNKIDWFHPVKTKCEPGENASFIIGTNDKNVEVLYEVVRKDKILHKEWLKLSGEQKLITFPVIEEYRGGFTINVVFVKHNRSFNHSINIEVPFTNKELVFEYETFRNKLVPGQKEEWRIKIKGKQGDSVTAELLASMYDASLDMFKQHNWNFSLYSNSYGTVSWQTNGAFGINSLRTIAPSYKISPPVIQQYDKLNWFGFNYYGPMPMGRGMHDKEMALPGQQMNLDSEMNSQTQVDGIAENMAATTGGLETPKPVTKSSEFQLRRDFRETAFFYPTLKTNKEGEAIISFEVPESLTRWKFMGLANTKDLKYGQFEKEIVTQKDLMIIPNVPRFFRQGDKMTFTAKVVNLSQNELTGKAEIQFFDARTMKDVTSLFDTKAVNETFTVKKGKSEPVSWDINIPDGIDVVTYRIKAQAENFTDGEEKAVPVLTNRMLVTESLPLPVNGNETKNFRFEKLLKSGKSSSLKNFKYTLEFSSNPAWYAVQALPYMMETEHESADDVFARYYANNIASYLVNSSPRIKQVFDTWKNYSPDALLSNLEKNEELKSVILEETPWVLDAESETERKQRIALLFDINRMSDELEASLRLLKQKQSPNGGWPWFKGMRESRNITQNIVTGFGHLQQLGIINVWGNPDVKRMISKAINFLDKEIKRDYDKLKEQNPDGIKGKYIGGLQIQYLYARSYFLKDMQIPGGTMEAFGFYRDQAKEYWLDQNIYLQGMIALAANRLGMKSLPSQIMASIKEHALYSEEMGMYWRGNKAGYYWYQAPVETQALLIEAFDEIMFDKKSVEQMKIWLLKQKQTQDWKTSKATAEAVYALMLRGSDWLTNSKLAIIKIGNKTIDPLKLEDSKVEAGTGYFKTSWAGNDVKSEMGNITVTNENENIAWGAVYWQYFEDLDKITEHETPLKLDKKLFIERNSDAGPVIEPVTDGMTLKVGDKIKVRIELRVDRNMEYVHMKDMRASAFEPVNTLSGYRYQGGLGYYQNIKDASTNFFFDYLRKGTYVFEYPLVVSQKGDFSNGITTIQCMYAPEFTSHSEGIRVEIK
jgi:hypothetical protein